MHADRPETPGPSVSRPASDRTITEILRILAAAPSALITDLDGTLSPIAPAPDRATVLPECREALARLSRKLELVAVLSGRTLEEARRMVGLDGLLYIGNHGLESWDEAHGRRVEAGAALPGMTGVLQALGRELGTVEGVGLEDKGAIVSIHYRLSPDAPTARRLVLDAAKKIARRYGLVVTEGKKVVEIRPAVPIDKGSAVRRLVRERRLKGLVYLGDDATDLDAFHALSEMRRTGELAGLAAAVDGPEAPGALLGLADAVLAGPEAVGDLLLAVADGLGRS